MMLYFHKMFLFLSSLQAALCFPKAWPCKTFVRISVYQTSFFISNIYSTIVVRFAVLRFCLFSCCFRVRFMYVDSYCIYSLSDYKLYF